jgi:hypothetical protein
MISQIKYSHITMLIDVLFKGRGKETPKSLTGVKYVMYITYFFYFVTIPI